jgi:hypothetical protein
MSTTTLSRFCVVILLGTHAALLLDGARTNFVTSDEVAHLAAGISHWKTGTYCLFRVNPPLPRMLAVIPVFLSAPRTDGIKSIDVPWARQEWEDGRRFAADNSDQYFKLVQLSRLSGVAWSLIGGWLVYRWASRLFGVSSGLLALALWCFEPNLLGHAQLLTPDVPATVAALAVCFAFWCLQQEPSWMRATICGVLLGVAFLTKLTLLILIPAFFLLWLLQSLIVMRDRDRLHPKPSLGRLLYLFAISLVVLNLGYEFSGTCTRLNEFPFVSHLLAGDLVGEVNIGNRFRQTLLGHLPIPLPADFVRGIDLQQHDFEVSSPRPSYLAGNLRYGGWWYYYLYGLAVKVPIGTWILFLWSIGVAYLNTNKLLEATLWLPCLLIFGIASSQTGFNHHLRYVFPIFPFVIVHISRLGRLMNSSSRLCRALIITCLICTCVSSLSIHPHQLSYFNELAGGPNNGHAHLLNSNIDWGQDLLFLKRWCDRHPEATSLSIAYANMIGPRFGGFDHFKLPQPGFRTLPSATQDDLGPLPGTYAVSVNFVRGARYWLSDSEDQLHYTDAREYAYFQHFRPIATAGYSIFIYRLTREETNEVRKLMNLPPC